MDIQQYQFNYPNLASFASDPSSPTYTRTSKTGKKVLVRKGKRKKLYVGGIITGALAGGLAGTTATVGAIKVGAKTGLLDGGNPAHLKAVGIGGNAAALAAIIGGGYIGNKLFRED